LPDILRNIAPKISLENSPYNPKQANKKFTSQFSQNLTMVND